MKLAGIRELRNHSAALLGGHEPVVVTRHGKVSGLYLPLDEADRLPADLKGELARVLGAHLSAMIEKKGVSEKEILEDFHAHRGRRR
ncbi:MAG: hypothetical protein NTW86_20085 [Candidatus Sumerlaeota bacterium]|nr:hypothetical protein [Candidatus Sumerlaeota bacterium]